MEKRPNVTFQKLAAKKITWKFLDPLEDEVLKFQDGFHFQVRAVSFREGFLLSSQVVFFFPGGTSAYVWARSLFLKGDTGKMLPAVGSFS